MKFGPVPTQDALGAILAHSVQAGAVKVRKGTTLNADHIATLLDNNHTTITVAELADRELHEDEAAAQLAAAIVPDPSSAGLRVSNAATGRVNIYAEAAGIVTIDRAGLEAFNSVDPMITIATLAPFKRVQAGAMVATVKIIAYGVPEADVKTACDVGACAMRLQQPVVNTATLIETQIGDMSLPLKGRDALNTRLKRLNVTLTERVVVPHEAVEIAQAIKAATGDVVLILTASATSDIHDTAPEGVRAAGGTVTHFGMPVDPGNLLFLGASQNKPVIGLPGCARSIAMNGADWILERVLCGVTVTPQDIAAMGVGGLLKESVGRTHPRQKGDV